MIAIVMGVVGAGKTLIGTLLANRLGWEFADADDFHSPENKEKMTRGIALTDTDRVPWLETLHKVLSQWDAGNRSGILACSALKESYRQRLSGGLKVRWVYLKGDSQIIKQRLAERHGHFADEKILQSQLETLQEPRDAIIVDIQGTPEEVIQEITLKLHS